jgi:hypothetical protein
VPSDRWKELIRLVERQRELQIATATGTRSESCSSEYVANRRSIVTVFSRLQIDDPFPWPDLWSWHGSYKYEYPTYQSRRDLISW